LPTTLDELTDAELLCRGGLAQHAWEEVAGEKTSSSIFQVVWRCTRCTLRRTDWYDWVGGLDKRWYSRTKDTRIRGGVTAAEVRQEFLRRRGVRLRAVKR
jgi:hypothetical protein